MVMQTIINTYKMKVYRQSPSHYMVTLPIAWVRGQNIGSMVNLAVLSDGSILVSPIYIVMNKDKNGPAYAGREEAGTWQTENSEGGADQK